MTKPEDWSIRYILENYYNALRYLEKSKNISYKKYVEKAENYKNAYIQALKLIFSNDNYSYGALFHIDSFVNDVLSGSFNECDGFGYYVDWDGNNIGPLNWKNPTQYPENTIFVAWYNK